MKEAMFAGIVLLTMISTSEAQQLKCDIGPVTKTFGGAAWLVYACDDGASIALITPNDSKAFPFFFGIQVLSDKININGEGTGNKAITDKAVKELRALKVSEIQGLRREALAAAKNKP